MPLAQFNIRLDPRDLGEIDAAVERRNRAAADSPATGRRITTPRISRTSLVVDAALADARSDAPPKDSTP